jgi:FdhD protein
MPRSQAPTTSIHRWQEGAWQAADDQLAAEEPLELWLDGEPLSIIMRTPGSDLELALGLLWAERVVVSLDQVERICISVEAEEDHPSVAVEPVLVEANRVDVHVRNGAGRRPQRSFVSTAACGVCGATTVEALALDFAELAPGPLVDASLLPRLVDELRAHQRLFDRTGGLHAAGLFDTDGQLLLLREDVGRHNAVDKVVGRALLDSMLPADRTVLAVSGRGGYEIVQKAVSAGIPVVAAVGAPSSLAVATAARFGMTLVGFLRDQRFNVYTRPERIAGSTGAGDQRRGYPPI